MSLQMTPGLDPAEKVAFGGRFLEAGMECGVFVTDNLDLALTKVRDGRPVRYTGAAIDALLFEGMKVIAQRHALELDRAANCISSQNGHEEMLPLEILWPIGWPAAHARGEDEPSVNL